MSIRTRPAAIYSMIALILLVQISIHFIHFFCPVHCHHSQDTAEPHLKAGDTHCLCFFMSFCAPCFDRILTFERAFGLTPVQADGQPLVPEGFEIFHPPLSA